MNSAQPSTTTRVRPASKRCAPSVIPKPTPRPRLEYYRLPRPAEELEGVTQCCMWDTEPLDPDREVVRAPIRFSRGTYYVMGQFCSFSCARSYICANSLLFARDAMSLLCQMAKSYYAVYNTIHAAPPQQALKKFGGYLSIEEFRARCVSHFSALRRPPHLFEDLRVEEKPRLNAPTAEVKSTLTAAEFKARLEESAKECLEKKQRKSNKLYANSLENLIGIKRQKLK